MDTQAGSSERWIVVADSAAVGRAPVARTAGGVALVLFRRLDGSVAALEDRCPHENVPLCTGRIVGDDIECEHHGLRFNGAGQCTYMPAQKAIPKRFLVKCFPVRERDGAILVLVS
jgi:vanillate O-demethylase monooxygenase subunit